MICLITFETAHHVEAADLFVVESHVDRKVDEHVIAICARGGVVRDVRFLAEQEARRMVDEELERDLGNLPSPSEEGSDPVRSPSQED
jgi:hypothetical protein